MQTVKQKKLHKLSESAQVNDNIKTLNNGTRNSHVKSTRLKDIAKCKKNISI